MKNLRIFPFGGVGEIGSNMTVFETENHQVIIDYGILFPSDNFFDINYLIADSSQLSKEKKLTLFITHGHEDHIGAVTHLLLEYPEIEVIAPEFPAILLRHKLERRKLKKHITIYQPEDSFKFDQYTLHPVHVTHSIPQTHGLVFHSKEFTTFFASDFKYDLNPSYERPFDTNKIKQLFAKSDTTLAMIDSTNILNENKTLSEQDLLGDLEKIITNNKRTFITMFSSNIYRLKNILELVKKNNKKITTIGRSLGHYLEAANEAKLLNLVDYPIIDIDAIQNYNDPNIIYMVTGSQGEFLGAAKRIINGDQKHINLCEDDQFVFSSKPIPGNEKTIYQLYNKLAEKNVEIINFRDMTIHASGHPGQEDLKQLISAIQPDYLIPIHGETYFLRKHITFIRNNFPKIKTKYLQNFEGIEVTASGLKSIKFDVKEPHLIHGNFVMIERAKISERRKMACNGVVFISLNHKTKNIQLQTKGLPEEMDEYLLKAKDLIDYTAFEELKNRDHDYVIEQIRIKIRNFYHSVLGYKPITIVQMV